MEKNIKTQLVFKFKTFAEKNLINTLLITINTTAILCNIAMMGKKKKPALVRKPLWPDDHYNSRLKTAINNVLPHVPH